MNSQSQSLKIPFGHVFIQAFQGKTVSRLIGFSLQTSLEIGSCVKCDVDNSPSFTKKMLISGLYDEGSFSDTRKAKIGNNVNEKNYEDATYLMSGFIIEICIQYC